jgi:hypothetical protein
MRPFGPCTSGGLARFTGALSHAPRADAAAATLAVTPRQYAPGTA